ncbi:MAG: TetR/AcrR family transcriptional regulator [Capsulimonadaceae bacterium]|nr:TetR/AcrR family transcriptional regulator [Capsulimonadaceae bacterium]
MSYSRAQIAPQRRAQILEAALRVFAVKGFAHATNKEIADAAGINSPGLIYHYFHDKADLLRNVMEAYAPPLQLTGDPGLLMGLPVEQGLRLLASKYLDIAANPQVIACLRLLIGEAMRSDELAQTVAALGPRRICSLISEYLTVKMERGEIRTIDPERTAWSFMGGLFAFILAGSLLHFDETLLQEPASLVDVHVGIFVRGLAPVPEASAPQGVCSGA